MGELRLYIKQTQLYDLQRQPVHYNGTNPQSLSVFTGALNQPRMWRNYGTFIDVSGDVGNLEQVSLTYTQDRTEFGISAPGSFQFKKSVSGSITIENEAYRLLKQWLVDDVAASFNKVDAKIYDSSCNVWYEGYQITNADLRYCEGEICEFNLNLRQEDEQLTCIKRTLISDDHQGWFPANGKPQTKKHPRFGYCNEIRPNGSLVAIWKLGTFNFMMTNTVLFAVVTVLNIVIAVVNAIIAIIRFFVNLFGGDEPPDYVDFISYKDILESQEESFVESAGCGREHPAPLVRDYIKNVCDKCGIKVDAASAPIFFSETQAVPYTSSGQFPDKNYHYNACYFYAPVRRGIRRVDNLRLLAPDYNDTDFWIDDNRPLLTLDSFLDSIKTIYNSEWRVSNGTLYFQRKDYWLNGAYILDLGKNGADRNRIIQGVCFEWNEVKYPAYTQGLYQVDDSDKCGNEARSFMNDIISHGSTLQNPNYEGFLDKNFQFGATRFRFDGITPDYIADAAQQNQNGGLFTSIFPIMRNVLAQFNGYELLLNEETASLPKLLIWDGESYLGARCVKNVAASSNVAPFNMPSINTAYNTGTTWEVKHPYNTFVKGQNFNLAGSAGYPDGYYTVRSFYGTETFQTRALLVNFPMYMASGYQGSMWDLFHFLDDPEKNPQINQSWTVRLEKCCDLIERLGIKNDASGIVLGQKVKLDRPFYPDGTIKEISLVNDPTDELGAHIEIKGE